MLTNGEFKTQRSIFIVNGDGGRDAYEIVYVGSGDGGHGRAQVIVFQFFCLM